VLVVVPPAAGGLPPPFIGQEEAVYNCAAVSATCGGTVYIVVESTAVLANLASGRALWRALYSSRCGFEGGGVGASSWSSCMRHFEGRVDGRPAVAQRRAWRRLVVPYPHSAGDGAAVPGMAAQ
jgi:hypothetical protein